MSTCPYHPIKPAWESDSLENTAEPLVEDAYFDEQMNAWVLSRYADVAAALRSSALVISGVSPKWNTALPQPVDLEEHHRLNVETRAALAPSIVARWREHTTQVGREIAAQFASGSTVDLMTDYAAPVCLALAMESTNAPISASSAQAEHLSQLAKKVSYTAADPMNAELEAAAEPANAELMQHIQTGPTFLRDTGFVAMAHTLAALLGNMWVALLQNPAQWQRLRKEPALLSRGTEELLRYAGLIRIRGRRALRDVTVNGHRIRAGDRVLLRLIAANHDPARFHEPEQMDVARTDAGHVSVGAGLHACTGAPLIRAGAMAATQPLLERFSTMELAAPIEWRGGMVFRAPEKLPVRLTVAEG